MAKQIEYPADTVDASGKVWATIGENIRNGKNGGGGINLDTLYPIGSVVLGVVPEPLKTFTWKLQDTEAPLYTKDTEGVSITTDQDGASGTTAGIALRLAIYVRTA